MIHMDPEGQKEPIGLWHLHSGLILIFVDQKGKRFSNQVGGYCCNHPEVIGHAYLILGTDEKGGLEDALTNHFTRDPYRGYCGAGWEWVNGCEGITVVTADFIDSILMNIPLSQRMRVDRTRLKECQEAWIYLLSENGCQSAVLTWNNSD